MWLFEKTKKSKQIRIKNKTVKGGKSGTKSLTKCSPISQKTPIGGDTTCFTEKAALELQTAFNQETVPSNRVLLAKPTEFLSSMKEKQRCNNDECLINSIKNPQIREKIKKTIFKPAQPRQWKKNPNEWLSNFDILEVLRQYEEAYPNFEFIGPVPIDFAERTENGGSCIENRLCHFSVGQLTKPDIGIIFNLDKHDEPGSHWVSMFIDSGSKTMFYFDSATSHESGDRTEGSTNDGELPKEIDAFQQKIQGQDSAYKFLSNEVEHQRGNSECGMYSLFFTIHMLLSKDRSNEFQTRFNNPRKKITDKDVEKYRHIYFI